jgi:hypothetical protein
VLRSLIASASTHRLDFWQRPIQGPVIRGQNYMGDVGFFGPDQGKGGKFLLLPSGYR